jgi:hypothetical protein
MVITSLQHECQAASARHRPCAKLDKYMQRWPNVTDEDTQRAERFVFKMCTASQLTVS